MKCFDVVQKVLDATYEEIPHDPPTRDSAITSSITGMSKQYRNELVRSGGPDFSDPITRFSYVFTYVPAHAHWLYELIGWSDATQEALKKPKIRATCLGGGPGSDLVGILKHLAEQGSTSTLFCEIIDGCIQWKQTWSDLAFTLDTDSKLHTDYVIHDVSDKDTWSSPSNVSKSDIVTISFFVSEIYYLGDLARNYLLGIFRKAKPGALFLVNDNNSRVFFEWLDDIAREASLETLLSGSGDRRIYDREESLAVVGEYKGKFNRTPRMTGSVFWRVFRKN